MSTLGVVDLDPLLIDFTDTAAAISKLDLVISVDTSLAHLAGALGKPVWVMVPHASDWRWRDEGEATPWYPSMTLFRQPKPNEWSDVFANVRSRLDAVLAGAGSMVPAAMAPSVETKVPAPLEPKLPDPRFSAVVYTCMGYVQYLPEQEDLATSLLLYGDYLPQQAAILARLVTAGATVIEAGSGIGFHAMALSRMLGPTGHLLAYESDPRSKWILKQNIAANGLPNVTIMRFPLRGLPSTNSAGNGVSPAIDAAVPQDRIPETVDGLGLTSLRLLKIEATADHASVIDGAEQTMWRSRPHFFASIATINEVPAVASRVRDFGYRTWRLDTPLFNPGNFNRRDRDVFDGRAATALIALPEEVAIGAAFEGAKELI